jgi:hypothetical protein
LWHARQPLEDLGMYVHPAMFSLPYADKAFDNTGRIIEESRRERLKSNLQQFLEYGGKLVNGAKPAGAA